MRRGWKIFWIVCGASIMVGFLFCAIALAMGVSRDMINDRFPYGIGWVREDEGDAAKEIHETFSGVTEIDMELAAGMVEFVEGDGGEIRVDTENLSRRLGFKCYMDGNELKLTSKKRFSGVNNIGRGKITVQIPRDLVFEEVSLSMGAGNLTVGQICCKELSVEIGAGEVNIDKFQADDAEFECGAGSITARGDVKSSADIHCGVGSIVYTASGREEEYNYDIQCGVGEVVCGDDTYSGLGKDRHIDNNADKDISIEGGVGSVIIDFDADRSR